MGLRLRIKKGQSFHLDDEGERTTITVDRCGTGAAYLHIEAPAHIEILRDKLLPECERSTR